MVIELGNDKGTNDEEQKSVPSLRMVEPCSRQKFWLAVSRKIIDIELVVIICENTMLT